MNGAPESYWWLQLIRNKWQLFPGNNSQSKESAFFDVATSLLLLLETYERQSVCSTTTAEKETPAEQSLTKSLETVSTQQQRDSGNVSLIKTMVFRCRNSKSRFQVVLKTHQGRRSLGLLLECGCAWITPSHAVAHVAAWSLFTSLQRAPADHLRFHNPTVCMYEHALRPSIREPPSTRSKWLSTQS